MKVFFDLGKTQYNRSFPFFPQEVEEQYYTTQGKNITLKKKIFFCCMEVKGISSFWWDFTQNNGI